MPSAEVEVIASVPKQLYIGGEWRQASNDGLLAVKDPATEEVLCEVADGTPDDARAALDAACEVQADWQATPPGERSRILQLAFEAVRARADDLALLMTLEVGKPIAESRAEVAYAAEFFRWFAGEALRLDGNYKVSADGGSRVIVLQQAVGPSLLITPWNFPLAMGTRKIGPALAAGCTMVVKPAQQTPLSMLALAKVLEESGLPGGVVNVLVTSQAGAATEPLLSDTRLRKLSFTGSTEVGRTLLRVAADTVLNCSMELGGNAPFIVFEDADVELAVEGAALAKMRNTGEACTAANRFIVAEAVADDFTHRLASRLEAMTVGRGTEEGVEVGPLIDGRQLESVDELVRDAVAAGADPLIGAERIDRPGHFYRPTVLDQVPPGSQLLQEEIFGPVAPITRFSAEDEAVAQANDTEYGLVAYVFTQGLSRALRVSEVLETGMVGLNRGLVSNAGAPFGGVKQSGLGREGGNEGIEAFLEPKYLSVAL